MTVVTRTEDDTEDLARRFAADLRGGEVVLLSGNLGSGKTTFVRGLAAGLGIAIAPRLALTNRRHDVRLVHFADDVPAPTRRILLSRTANRPPTPAASAMTDIMRAVAQRFTDSNLNRTQLGTVRTG